MSGYIQLVAKSPAQSWILGSSQRSTSIEFEVLPFEAPADAQYGSLRSLLERAGKPIGANDLFIAAQALALGHMIVTDNEREFARVRGLRPENWLRKN
ncbi:MAG TPA: PIN domain-containing protein [Terriglobales bacterium]|nr:PIN domain-containing protein [Terriglobales bacterium]